VNNPFLVIPLCLLAYVVAQWAASLLLRDASIVDRYWGGGFVVAAAVAYLYADEKTPGAMLLLALAAIWGLRLSIYLTWRNWGHGEDYRYVAMRKRHGAKFPIRSLFTVFILQGALTWFISLPLQVGILRHASALGALDYIGAGVCLIGVLFETVGDWQLARFKADPANAGRVMDRGLWRYTRHPNYFGDAVAWWGMYLVAASAPGGAFTVLSPALMTFLLVRVSGVALLEKKLKKTRPEYEDYVRRTNAFLPGMPGK
jgi:steroid 5-alpha reductase family enzyme